MTEKTRSGPQRPKFPPPCPKFEPLPKRLFSQDNSMGPLCQRDLRIIRRNPKNNLPESNGEERIALDPIFFEQTRKLQLDIELFIGATQNVWTIFIIGRVMEH